MAKPKAKSPQETGDKPGKVRKMGIFAAADGKKPNKPNLSRGKKIKHVPCRAGIMEKESAVYFRSFPI